MQSTLVLSQFLQIVPTFVKSYDISHIYNYHVIMQYFVSKFFCMYNIKLINKNKVYNANEIFDNPPEIPQIFLLSFKPKT